MTAISAVLLLSITISACTCQDPSINVLMLLQPGELSACLCVCICIAAHCCLALQLAALAFADRACEPSASARAEFSMGCHPEGLLPCIPRAAAPDADLHGVTCSRLTSRTELMDPVGSCRWWEMRAWPRSSATVTPPCAATSCLQPPSTSRLQTFGSPRHPSRTAARLLVCWAS